MLTLVHKQLMLSSKEELVDLVLELQNENQQLQKENQHLKKEIEKLQERWTRPAKDSHNSSKAPSTDEKANRVKEEGEAKKKGPSFGHEGTSRRTREADIVLVQKVKECPACKTKIESASNTYTVHQIYELPPMRILTIDILRQKTTCPGCQRTVVALNPEGIENHRAFGPRLEALVGILHHQHHIPQDRVKVLLQDLFKESLADGSIDSLLSRVREKLEDDYEELGRQLRKEDVLGADETGWRVNGEKGWLWAFQNEGISYYTIEDNRSSKVPQAVLGKRFQGTLVTDFYSAYEKIKAARKQKCNAHLLRDLEYGKEVEAGHDDFCQCVSSLIQQAMALAKQRAQLTVGEYKKQVLAVEKKLDEYLEKEPKTKEGQRLKKRMRKHRQELFVFLYDASVPADNNGTERAIRIGVIHRKISNGSRSDVGAQRFSITLSLIETMKKRGEDVFDTLVMLLGGSFLSAQLEPEPT
jgi:transposase